jgi:hypothetical protein
MGNSTSIANSSDPKDYFIIERIVASMCNYCNPDTLTMGVFGHPKDATSPYKGLGLRIGDQPILELREYTKTPTSIKYEFQNNTSLHFFRTELKEVAYRLKTPTLDELRTVDPLLCKNFKTINMDNSGPLDELKEIMR